MGVISVKTGHPGNIPGKYKKAFGDPVSLLLSAKKGLSPLAVFDFLSFSKLPNGTIEHLLSKTLKTFNTYKTNNTALDATTSEKLLKLFGLYDKGCTVFGSINAFNDWLSKPSFGLGGQVPDTILDTITGINMIYEELVNIEYGNLA